MFETVILGAGAAGTGSLVWAARHGLLGAWLDAGVAVVDARFSMSGTIGRYVLNADTLGGTFLECLDGPCCDPVILNLRSDPVTLELAGWRDRYPPLELVGRFLERLGTALAGMVCGHPRSLFLAGAVARGVRLQADGSLVADISEADGRRHSLRAASAVMALGGRQNTSWETVQLMPGLHLGHWRAKIIPSDLLMARGGAFHARRMLARARSAPLAVILGGAHSAFSAAWLLDRLSGIHFDAAGIQILHRTDPRVFYPSCEAAAADGYEFTDADVCPATGRVFRLSGLRGDGREVWRRMHGLAGDEAERLFVTKSIHSMQRQELACLLDAADLIVPAFGYRMATVPMFDASGRPIPLARAGPAVGSDSRLLIEGGDALPNVFGAGLGSGFRPWGAMAGEPSFHGQQNSLWLYQNGIGEQICTGVRTCALQHKETAARRLGRSPVIA